MLRGMVKATGLLASPSTVTTRFPVVAPEGTGTLMVVSSQLVGRPVVPLNVTVLFPWLEPKLDPLMVTGVPVVPDGGDTLLMAGGVGNTVKLTALLTAPDTFTARLPVLARDGTGTTMLVGLQLVGIPAVPLNVTAPLP
jgi:hypothetical protein